MDGGGECNCIYIECCVVGARATNPSQRSLLKEVETRFQAALGDTKPTTHLVTEQQSPGL